MKKIIFVICFLMLVKPMVPVFEYICNYDYIANQLCENKENTVMACNGKCYLMKQLAEESEAEKPLSSDKKHAVAETSDLFLNALQGYDLRQAAFFKSGSANVGYTNFYALLHTDSFFHPPTVAA